MYIGQPYGGPCPIDAFDDELLRIERLLEEVVKDIRKIARDLRRTQPPPPPPPKSVEERLKDLRKIFRDMAKAEKRTRASSGVTGQLGGTGSHRSRRPGGK